MGTLGHDDTHDRLRVEVAPESEGRSGLPKTKMGKDAMTPLEITKFSEFIRSEPEYPRSVWKDLGLWRGLKMTVWMVLHPYANARISAVACKRSLLNRLNKEKP